MAAMTRGCDGLLLDIGLVVVKSPWELADIYEQAHGLPPRTIPGRGPFDTVSGDHEDDRWEAYRRGELTEPQYWKDFNDRTIAAGVELGDHPNVMRLLLRDAGEAGVRPEAVALMRACREAGVRVGFLSNEMYEFHTREWALQQPWFQLADFAVDSSDVGVRKPAPEPYAAAIEAMGLPPERTVFVDDNPSYVAGGEKAGLRCVLLDVLEPWVALDEAASLVGLAPMGRLAR